VTICHSRTHDLASITKEADILIAAIGKPFFVTGEMVREGSVVIDVGINRVTPASSFADAIREDGKLEALREGKNVLVGDVDFQAAAAKASWITPVPGGVGPMTIAMLMKNTVIAARERRR
jgi:methylenetetrahydrofolate dehydrogenase (NADP+)/methenyltetrahydrofolate cyclohydrolase